MRFALLYNPEAGRGRASGIAERFAEALGAAGHDLVRARVGNGDREQGIAVDEALDGVDAAVVIGGDGTVHHLAATLIERRAPVYHAPTGTENLFARQFGTDERPATFLEALESGRTVEVDAGVADGRPFLIMASAGFDAGVIARLAAAREGPISHLSYLRPILSEMLAPRRSLFTVLVDGERVVDSEPGLVVVGNSRQYAMRIDPAAKADMMDGLLDVVFFPARSRLGLVLWAIRSRLGRHTHNRRLVYTTGRSVEIASDVSDTPVQIDGEAAGTIGGRASGRLEISVRPRALRVVAGRSPGQGV